MLTDYEFDRTLIQVQRDWDSLDPDDKRKLGQGWVTRVRRDNPQLSRKQAQELYEKVVLGIGL